MEYTIISTSDRKDGPDVEVIGPYTGSKTIPIFLHKHDESSPRYF